MPGSAPAGHLRSGIALAFFCFFQLPRKLLNALDNHLRGREPSIEFLLFVKHQRNRKNKYIENRQYPDGHDADGNEWFALDIEHPRGPPE